MHQNNRKIYEFYYSATYKERHKPGLPLVLKDSVQFLNNSLDNLVKHLAENDFYHLSHEFNANVLNLLKKKGFLPYDYWESFGKFLKGLPTNDKSHNTLANRELVIKFINMFLKFGKFLK